MARVRAFVCASEIENKEAVLERLRQHIDEFGFTAADLRTRLPTITDEAFKRLKSGRDDETTSYSRACSIAEGLGLVVKPTFQIDPALMPRRRTTPRPSSGLHKRGLSVRPPQVSMTA